MKIIKLKINNLSDNEKLLKYLRFIFINYFNGEKAKNRRDSVGKDKSLSLLACNGKSKYN